MTRWLDPAATLSALQVGPEAVVRLRLRDGRIMIGRARQLAPNRFAFHAFGQRRAVRLFLHRVKAASVFSFERHAHYVATVAAQRRGDFSGRTLPRFMTTRAESSS